MRDAGFSVLAYDYSGYGLSTGRPSERAAYADIDAAYDYLVQARACRRSASSCTGGRWAARWRRTWPAGARSRGWCWRAPSPPPTAWRGCIPFVPFDRFRTHRQAAPHPHAGAGDPRHGRRADPLLARAAAVRPGAAGPSSGCGCAAPPTTTCPGWRANATGRRSAPSRIRCRRRKRETRDHDADEWMLAACALAACGSADRRGDADARGGWTASPRGRSRILPRARGGCRGPARADTRSPFACTRRSRAWWTASPSRTAAAWCRRCFPRRTTCRRRRGWSASPASDLDFDGHADLGLRDGAVDGRLALGVLAAGPGRPAASTTPACTRRCSPIPPPAS